MTHRTVCRSAVQCLALGAMLVLGAHAAQAAAIPVTTTPARYAALIHPPRVIRLIFSEAIVPKSSTLSLTDLAGHDVRVKPVKAHGNNSLEARIAAKLDAGVYMVHWTTVSAVDGSKVTGRYQFTVQ